MRSSILPSGVQSSTSRNPTGSISPSPESARPTRNASTEGADFEGSNSQLERLTDPTRGADPTGRLPTAHGTLAGGLPSAVARRIPLEPTFNCTAEIPSVTWAEAPGPRFRWDGSAVKPIAEGWSATDANPISSAWRETFLTVIARDVLQAFPLARPRPSVAGSTTSFASAAAAGSTRPAPWRVTASPTGEAEPTKTALSSLGLRSEERRVGKECR